MAPIAHFSHGLRVGDEIHLGAAAGTDANRRLAGTLPGLTDVRAQTVQLYRNMKLALELLGGRAEDVARIKNYLVDWRDFGGYDEAYREHWPLQPSRTTVGTWGFPLPFAVIEAELTAVVGSSAAGRYGVAVGDGVEGVAAQTQKALAGMKQGDIVKLTVTLAELRDYPAFEEAFKKSWQPPYPARTVSVAPLSQPQRRVEIESVAVAGGGRPVNGLGAFPSLGAASPAMLAGQHLYVSAQAGIDRQGRLASGPEAQSRAAWERICALLSEAGMDVTDVVRTNNWLTDWRSYAAFNAGYGAFVVEPYPPRATVIGSLLEAGALVQIEAIAHAEGRNATVLVRG